MTLRKEQFNFRFQKATGQLENTGRIRYRAPRHRAHQDGAIRTEIGQGARRETRKEGESRKSGSRAEKEKVKE